MKKCKICQKEIDENEEVCNSCIDFFKWKYKKTYCKKLRRFQKIMSRNPSLNSTKFKTGGIKWTEKSTLS